MFSGSINDTSSVFRMMIVGDATTWSITSDNSKGVIYDCNIFIIQATVLGHGVIAVTNNGRWAAKVETDGVDEC